MDARYYYSLCLELVSTDDDSSSPKRKKRKGSLSSVLTRVRQKPKSPQLS